AAQRVASIQHIPIVATFHPKYRDDFSRIIKYGFKGNVEVVDNGCDFVADYPESYFKDSRLKLGIAPDEFVMLFVGQHIWEKNIRFILDGLEKLKDLPFKMFFVGEGYAADEMKHIIQEKSLEDKISLVGGIKDREMIKSYYACADLFLFPSLYDNAPLVVREAAALHTPAIMIKGATASSIITDGVDGFLVENSVDDYAQRIRDLASKPQQVSRVGVQASKSIVRSWEDVAGEVLDRYNCLIRRKNEIHPM
ncbi:MAG: glycosyltransferase, partial [Bacteroidales bacterium]|nr:glycosyltransferase [Bacteroidales bacterium]